MSARAEKGRNDEIGALSESINHMADEMQKVDQLKNEFIASVTHELKTPLTSMKGWAATLADTGPEDFDIIKRGIFIIKNETDRLEQMVEELLDFSRLRSGRFSLQKKAADIGVLITDVCRQMELRAERQGIMLETSIPEGKLEFDVDERRIRQVFVNLLDNSLKFTPSGGKITVSATPDGAITVEDNGDGIEKNAGKKSGMGLGLSICEELIKAHGGSMDISSAIGKGTKVVIRLSNSMQ